ncbi:hypothetical protein SAMN04488121_110154 [Chitinophaga filiformis]|uniref:Uncharacterized protein n=1 Tax=Chitinophaga filiformis TaxID=104663 RepID=A0A1G8B7Z0_CHIFI|nr:hypothetical protein SAMN04488121_110154 [Chitinophaga filiformis]
MSEDVEQAQDRKNNCQSYNYFISSKILVPAVFHHPTNKQHYYYPSSVMESVSTFFEKNSTNILRFRTILYICNPNREQRERKQKVLN